MGFGWGCVASGIIWAPPGNKVGSSMLTLIEFTTREFAGGGVAFCAWVGFLLKYRLKCHLLESEGEGVLLDDEDVELGPELEEPAEPSTLLFK